MFEKKTHFRKQNFRKSHQIPRNLDELRKSYEIYPWREGVRFIPARLITVNNAKNKF